MFNWIDDPGEALFKLIASPGHKHGPTKMR